MNYSKRKVSLPGFNIKSFALIAALLFFNASVFGQTKDTGKDYVESHPEFYNVILDNDNIRVIEYTLEPGEKEGWHIHPEGMLYTIEGGPLKVEFKEGDPMVIEEVEGEAKYFEETPKHTAENISGKRVKLLIVEFKKQDKKDQAG